LGREFQAVLRVFATFFGIAGHYNTT
jgi:hypothetical protein